MDGAGYDRESSSRGPSGSSSDSYGRPYFSSNQRPRSTARQCRLQKGGAPSRSGSNSLPQMEQRSEDTTNARLSTGLLHNARAGHDSVAPALAFDFSVLFFPEALEPESPLERDFFSASAPFL